MSAVTWSTKKRRREQATRNEADRAVYIDFEGLKDEAPSLVGILVDGHFEQVVLDPVLAAAAVARGLRVAEGEEVMGTLIRQAAIETRRIAAFTRHELKVSGERFGVDIGPYYLDGHKLAKRWWNALKPCVKPRCWTQQEFERRVGINRPKHLRGNAAKRIRAVRGQLETRGTYEGLTTTKKGQWTKLLRYNEADVRNLEVIVGHAAAELESRRGAAMTGRDADRSRERWHIEPGRFGKRPVPHQQ